VVRAADDAAIACGAESNSSSTDSCIQHRNLLKFFAQRQRLPVCPRLSFSAALTVLC